MESSISHILISEITFPNFFYLQHKLTSESFIENFRVPVIIITNENYFLFQKLKRKWHRTPSISYLSLTPIESFGAQTRFLQSSVIFIIK